MQKKMIAVVLAGCGNRDGSEIHEATLTLWAIHKNGAEYQCFAPDIPQHHVVNHLTGKEMEETRNVLVESARIARGKIKDIKQLKPADFDALIFPGGMGAAKNLCTYALDGPQSKVNDDVPGEFKGAAFRKGHTVCEDDLCRMQRLGKNHLYVLELAADEIHENEAAAILAEALAGDGVVWENNPREGKIDLYAAFDGLLRVDVPSLAAFNLVDEVMCATLHNHTVVKKGDKIAATRAIPLIMKRAAIERAAAIALQNGAVVAVKQLTQARPGLIITGNEVYHGLIEDRFAPTLTNKVGTGTALAKVREVPAPAEGKVRETIAQMRKSGFVFPVTMGISPFNLPSNPYPLSIVSYSGMNYVAGVFEKGIPIRTEIGAGNIPYSKILQI